MKAMITTLDESRLVSRPTIFVRQKYEEDRALDDCLAALGKVKQLREENHFSFAKEAMDSKIILQRTYAADNHQKEEDCYAYTDRDPAKRHLTGIRFAKNDEGTYYVVVDILLGKYTLSGVYYDKQQAVFAFDEACANIRPVQLRYYMAADGGAFHTGYGVSDEVLQLLGTQKVK